MNKTQLSAIQDFYSLVTSKEVTMTAREMALTSHNLSKSGDLATTKDGCFVWNNTRQLWVKFR